MRIRKRELRVHDKYGLRQFEPQMTVAHVQRSATFMGVPVFGMFELSAAKALAAGERQAAARAACRHHKIELVDLTVHPSWEAPPGDVRSLGQRAVDPPPWNGKTTSHPRLPGPLRRGSQPDSETCGVITRSLRVQVRRR